MNNSLNTKPNLRNQQDFSASDSRQLDCFDDEIFENLPQIFFQESSQKVLVEESNEFASQDLCVLEENDLLVEENLILVDLDVSSSAPSIQISKQESESIVLNLTSRSVSSEYAGFANFDKHFSELTFVDLRKVKSSPVSNKSGNSDSLPSDKDYKKRSPEFDFAIKIPVLNDSLEQEGMEHGIAEKEV